MNFALRLVVSASFAIVAVNAAEPLEKVFARMDASATGFRSMSGNVKKVSHTKILNDTSEESGTILLKKAGTKDLKMLMNISDPDPKSYSFADRKAEIYFPKLQTVQVYDLGKQSDLLDQFLLLGFGSTSKELSRGYDVKVGGDDTVAGAKTVRLELTPKSAKVREHLRRAELWLDSAGHTVQQKFHEPSGDYRLITYTDVKWNADVPESSLKLNLPKGIKREYPQK